MTELFFILNTSLLSLAFVLRLESSLKAPRLLTVVAAIALLSYLLFIDSGKGFSLQVNSLINELSITSYCLLVYYLIEKILLKKEINHSPKARTINYSLIGLSGISFYILSLGYSSFDPYLFGYNAFFLAAITSCFAVFYAWKESFHVSIILCLVVCCYAGGVLDSNNFWDYLLDPLLVIYAVAYSFITACKSLIERIGDNLTGLHKLVL